LTLIEDAHVARGEKKRHVRLIMRWAGSQGTKADLGTAKHKKNRTKYACHRLRLHKKGKGKKVGKKKKKEHAGSLQNDAVSSLRFLGEGGKKRPFL